MMASLSLLTLSLLPAAPAAGVLSRRAVLACAPVALAAMPNAAHASAFSTELGEAEAALEASDGRSVLPAINRLLEIATEYGGMPSDELRRELIEKVLAKRAQLKSVGEWDEGSYGEKEEQYLRLQRAVDPWRVVELQDRAQLAILGFAPVYIGLIAVQQFVPKVFNLAYAAGVLLLFGPLLYQILFG